MSAHANTLSDLQIDIGSGSKHHSLSQRLEEGSNYGLIGSAAGFMAGVACLTAQQPDVAATLFYASGMAAKGLATVGLGAKLSQIAIPASRFAYERLSVMMGMPSLSDKLKCAEFALKDIAVGAKGFVKDAWNNKIGTGLVLTNIAILSMGASMLNNQIISAIPEGAPRLLDSFKELAEGVAYAMHPHFPTGIATALATLGHGGAEISESSHWKKTGDSLQAVRNMWLHDLASIVSRENPQARAYAFDTVEEDRVHKILNNEPVYAEEYFEMLRDASITGKVPKLNDVTSGLGAYILGNKATFKRELDTLIAAHSINDRSPSQTATRKTLGL